MEFLKKKEVPCFAIATNILPEKERFAKFYKSEHREFWLLPNKKKHGPETILLGDVVTSQRMWKDGFLHGEERNFTHKGEFYGTRTWKMGIRHGRSTRIHRGNTVEKWWEDGKLVHGKCTSDSGHVFWSLRYGTTMSYREDGTICRIYSKNSWWAFSDNGSVKRYFI
ncbi:hypothetical protein ISTM_54 [Insectomime virus]|nr:hypothetical protein ISTM_54 [Insectomime virus]